MAAPVLAQTNYYVNASTGSDSNTPVQAQNPGTPWATLTHAIQFFSLGTNGSVINVACGSYPGKIVYTGSGNSNSQRIRIVSANPATYCAVITGTTGNAVEFGTGATAHGGNFISLEGFEVTCPNCDQGIVLHGNNSWAIHNKVHHIQRSSPNGSCPADGGAGIANQYNGVTDPTSQSNNIIDSNYVYMIGVFPTLCNRTHGIYVQTQNNRITNNIVFETAGYGLQTFHYVARNIVSNNTIFNTAESCYFLSADSTGIADDFNTLTNNIAVNCNRANTSGGIRVTSGGSDPEGPNNFLSNNLTFGNNGGNYNLQNAAALNQVTSGTTGTVFVNYTGTETGDYHLVAGSPAIGAGGSSCASGVTGCVPPTDADGVVRPSGGAQDIGAYAKTSAGVPIVNFNPSPLTFGTIAVGSSSSVQTSNLKNTGGAALNITAKSISGANAADFAETDTCGASLAAGASCAFNVTFTPHAAGVRSANVTITDNASGSPHQLPLNGTGGSILLTPSPTSISFPSTQVGQCSAVQSVNLISNGTQAATVGTSVIGGSNPGDFQFGGVGTCSTGQVLSPGQSCTISLKFCPTATGARSATDSTPSNASNSPAVVPLTGTGTTAIASLTPASFDYGNVVVFTPSAAHGFTFSNTGTGGIGSIVVSLAGANAADFSLSNNTCGTSLGIGASCSVNVTCTPTVASARTASLSITSSASTSPNTSALTCTGIATHPNVVLPAGVNFGNQPVGTTSGILPITLQNNGTGPLNISSIVAGTHFAQTNTCGASVVAGASCTINLTFTPATAGTTTGTLTVTDDASNSPQVVPLQGFGTQAGAMLSPSSLTFSNQQVGTPSASQTEVLTNTGNVTLSNSSIGTTGTNAADFITSTNCPTNLAPGAFCNIGVIFQPSNTGVRTATLSVSNSALNAPQTASLSGTGIAAIPAVTLSPTSIPFGNQQQFTSSSSRTIQLTNSGNSSLTITSILSTGANAADFVRTNNCGASLAAGGVCTVSVVFTPSTTAAETAAITFTTNASTSPDSVSLTGTGTAVPAPAVTLSPASLNFGTVTVGRPSGGMVITLLNSGNASLTTANSIAIAGTNPGDFSQTNNCPANLAAQTPCAVTVNFTPAASGARSATVTFTNNAPGSPQSVTLSGTGRTGHGKHKIAVNSINFGNQVVNTTSTPVIFTITNIGDAALDISSIAVSPEFAQSNTCPSSLAIGATCSVTSNFVPTVVGSASDSLTVTDDDPAGPGIVALSGVGLPAPPPPGPVIVGYGGNSGTGGNSGVGVQP